MADRRSVPLPSIGAYNDVVAPVSASGTSTRTLAPSRHIGYYPPVTPRSSFYVGVSGRRERLSLRGAAAVGSRGLASRAAGRRPLSVAEVDESDAAFFDGIRQQVPARERSSSRVAELGPPRLPVASSSAAAAAAAAAGATLRPANSAGQGLAGSSQADARASRTLGKAVSASESVLELHPGSLPRHVTASPGPADVEVEADTETEVPASSLSMKARICKSLRVNATAGIVLNLLGVTIVALYYLSEGMREVMNPLGDLHDRYGYLYSFVGTALFGGFIPFVIMLAMAPALRCTRWWMCTRFLFFVSFWGLQGCIMNTVIALQVRMFGEDPLPQVVVYKTLFDQFVYSTFWDAWWSAMWTRWEQLDFSFPRLFRECVCNSYWWKDSVLVTIVGTYMVWIPGSAITYILPVPLQMPLYNMILTFWVLLLVILTDEPAHSTGDGAADAADDEDEEVDALGVGAAVEGGVVGATGGAKVGTGGVGGGGADTQRGASLSIEDAADHHNAGRIADAHAAHTPASDQEYGGAVLPGRVAGAGRSEVELGLVVPRTGNVGAWTTGAGPLLPAGLEHVKSGPATARGLLALPGAPGTAGAASSAAGAALASSTPRMPPVLSYSASVPAVVGCGLSGPLLDTGAAGRAEAGGDAGGADHHAVAVEAAATVLRALTPGHERRALPLNPARPRAMGAGLLSSSDGGSGRLGAPADLLPLPGGVGNASPGVPTAAVRDSASVALASPLPPLPPPNPFRANAGPGADVGAATGLPAAAGTRPKSASIPAHLLSLDVGALGHGVGGLPTGATEVSVPAQAPPFGAGLSGFTNAQSSTIPASRAGAAQPHGHT